MFNHICQLTTDVNPGIELEAVVNSADKKHIATKPVDKKLLKINKKLMAAASKKQ